MFLLQTIPVDILEELLKCLLPFGTKQNFCYRYFGLYLFGGDECWRSINNRERLDLISYNGEPGEWFAAVRGTGKLGANAVCSESVIVVTGGGGGNSSSGGGSSATVKRRRHSVASHPQIPNNSQSVFQIAMITTPTSTATTTTASTTALKTAKVATKSHQRTLSLPLAAVVVNQAQSSKRSVLRCMYFSSNDSSFIFPSFNISAKKLRSFLHVLFFLPFFNLKFL